MPSFVKVNKKKKNGGKKQKRHSIDPVEEVIEEQQKSSIMKVNMIMKTIEKRRYIYFLL